MQLAAHHVMIADSDPSLQKQTPTLGRESALRTAMPPLPILAFQGLRQTGRLTSWGSGARGARNWDSRGMWVIYITCRAAAQDLSRASQTDVHSQQITSRDGFKGKPGLADEWLRPARGSKNDFKVAGGCDSERSEQKWKAPQQVSDPPGGLALLEVNNRATLRMSLPGSRSPTPLPPAYVFPWGFEPELPPIGQIRLPDRNRP